MEKYNAETLKPCPFCGGEATFGTRACNTHHVRCDGCGDEHVMCVNGESYDDSMKKAITTWNTRQTTEPVVSEREVRECPDVQKRLGLVPISEVLELLESIGEGDIAVSIAIIKLKQKYLGQSEDVRSVSVKHEKGA